MVCNKLEMIFCLRIFRLLGNELWQCTMSQQENLRNIRTIGVIFDTFI